MALDAFTGVRNAITSASLNSANVAGNPPPAPAFWETDPDAWDTFLIGNIPAFGLATVTVRKAHVVDNKTPQGTIDNVPTHLGVEPAQVNISVRMWLQEHLNNYQSAARLVHPPDGSAPQPIRCRHPLLSIHGIDALYFVLIDPPKPSSTKGVWECSFVAQEWAPATGRGAVITWTSAGDGPKSANYGTTIERLPSDGKGPGT